jgi:hypothetical protein
VLLGLGLRLYHYLRDPSVWGDEAAVIVSVLQKSFPDLLGPLYFDEAAPPLFLWGEKAVGLLLGEASFVWRLGPFLASCAALLLLVPVARRTLPAEAVPWAVFLFASSDRILWHSCEAKPYAVDLLCATVVLTAYAATRAWPLPRRLALFAALAPVLIFLSYPGCFLCGGLLVVLLPAAWRAREPGARLGYGLLTLTTFASFALLLVGPIRAQRPGQVEHLFYYENQFPRWVDPWTVPGWTAGACFEMLRYCCKPSGGLLLFLFVLGAARLWRQGQRELVALLTVPIALALLASYGYFYPFGHARLELYATPAVVLLLAAGVPPACSWLRGRGRFGVVAGGGVLLGLLLAPLGLSLYRVAVPWDRADSAAAAAHVLARRGPDEAVTSAQWEYSYYFRRLGSAFQVIKEPVSRTDPRLWAVVAGETPEQRLHDVRILLPGAWHVLERRDFTGTSVFLLSQPDDAGRQAGSIRTPDPPRSGGEGHPSSMMNGAR